MEPLEFGDLLMRRRPRLEALASWLVEDRHHVALAVRQALADTWRARELLPSEIEMDAFLYTHLRSSLQITAGRPR